MKILILVIMISITGILSAQTKFPLINKQINEGNFSKAEELINNKIDNEDLSDEEKYNLKFQMDLMHRIKLDFNKTKEDILPAIRKYFPEVTDEMIAEWERDNSLEYKIIDGQKKYFHNSVPNLFRVNQKAKKQKEKIDGIAKSKLNEFLSKDIPSIINESKAEGKILVNPVRIKINYTLTVDKNAAPDGEIIRCWLPYPKENHKRQIDVKLISTNDKNYIIAPDSYAQRSLYMEKPAERNKPTVFKMGLEYTAYAEWYNLSPQKIKDYNKDSDLYKTYTSKRPPHIVFTDKIKKLSKEIIGDEKNPYNQIKLIFNWISYNIPWASAREYSTIENISNYCITTMHGDCGIKGLLFITLCRLNGIPAKWQSGWMMHPGSVNLHDWTEVYFEGFGWIPVDPYMGVKDFDDPEAQYFFTSGTDAYHFIVNDDYSQPFFPAKIYPRSETVDFQRGEVEWKGGNLYFNKWDYNMEVEYESLSGK